MRTATQRKAHVARGRRWYRNNLERARELARGYARRDSAIRSEKCRAWRESKRVENPDFARQASADYRARNPNYTREYRRRRALRAAWLVWSTTCAANRRAMEARDVSAN